MSKKKKIMGIIIGLVIVLAIAIPIGTGKLDVGGQISKVFNNASSDEKSNGDKNNQGKDGSKNEQSKEDSKDGQSKDTTDAKSGEDTSQGTNGSNQTSGGNGTSQNDSSGDGSISNHSDTGQKVSPNYKAPDEKLTIQRIQGYTGIYIEDGSDEEVKNVAAIEVKNTSKKAIQYAQIQLYNGDKKLLFDVSTLPANSSAIVMEKNKAAFSEKDGVTYGGTTVAYLDKLEKSSDIKYSKVGNNGIKVTNKSKKDIPCVRIFYKFKADEGYYIGGITYTAKIEDLNAGESKTVYPSHFTSDGGKILMIKTYESKE